jgi:hypothetical protein
MSRDPGLTTHRVRLGWGVLLAVGAVWEAVGLVRRWRGDTLSEVVVEASEAWEPLPLAVGMVAGHWFPRGRALGLLLCGVGLGLTLWPIGGKRNHGDD